MSYTTLLIVTILLGAVLRMWTDNHRYPSLVADCPRSARGLAGALIWREGRDGRDKFQTSRLRLRHLELITTITPKSGCGPWQATAHVSFYC